MTSASLLNSTKTIAIVGLSDNPERYSYQVATYLKDAGYTIIPVNPNIDSVLGQKAYASLSDIPQNISVDVVDIFRKSAFVHDIVTEAIARGDIKAIWMQEGIEDEKAQNIAQDNGIEVIMNMCMMKAHNKEHGQKN